VREGDEDQDGKKGAEEFSHLVPRKMDMGEGPMPRIDGISITCRGRGSYRNVGYSGVDG
jgi:hypothetical protein